jgi:acetyl esterase/lipase
MSEQQRAAVHQLLRNGPLDLGGDLAVQRPLFEEMLTAHPLPEDVTATPTEIGGVPALRIQTADTQEGTAVLYFHGGAYAVGSAASSAGLAAAVARHSGSPVTTVDYRLAPEHPYPAALDDAVAAYRGLLDSGIPAQRVAVAGESAGGGLALALLVALKNTPLPQPAAAAVFSPWTDLTISGASINNKATADPALTAAGLRLRAADYTGTTNPANPQISPVFADLKGLPPLLIQAGSHEILLDDATRLATQAAAHDVAVILQVTPGVPHVFQGFADILDEGTAALTAAGTFLRTHLRTPVPAGTSHSRW